MSTENKTEAAKDLIAKICDKYGNGNFIFRGTKNIFSEDSDGVNSSIYRWVKRNPINKQYKPPKIEENRVKKARKYFPDKTSNIEILTDIRHYGGKVNLIDFTRSIYAALFFACNGDFNIDGEIIVLDTYKLPRMTDIDYGNLKDGEMGVIEPAKTQTSQLRVAAQDSIFVYFVDGYIEKSCFKEEKIPKALKEYILDFIKKFSNIDQDTVYNDLIGFIANEKNYDMASIHVYQGNVKSYSGGYEEAIMEYDKAIELDPKSAEAYHGRGFLKGLLGKDEEAIQDNTKAIEIDSQDAYAYRNRGQSKDHLGDTAGAEADLAKARELEEQQKKK